MTLRQLWDFRTPASELTLTSYERIGRLDGAIARTAETVMAASRLDADDLAQLRRAFLGMVRIDREGHFSRRPLRLNDLQGRQREVLLRFVNEGLLVIGSTPGAIDLAHEALIRTWPLLASWVEGAREDLLRLERFETAVEQWRQNRKAVLQGIGLAEAEELALKGYDALNSQDATQLLDLSRKERNQASAREQERLQSLRVSESLRLASEAREASVQEPETAFLVAWEAVLWDRNEVSEAVFRETLNRLPASVMILRPGSGNLYISAGFAGNGMTLFAADTRNGAVSVWELDGRPLSRFVVSGDGTMAIAALPGRSELITCRGQIARLHSVDGRILHELPLDPSPPKASDGLAISVAADCTCLIHAHGKGWLIHVGEGRDRLLRLMRSLDFVWLPSRTGEMPTEQDWDGPFHQPFSRILDATIKQDGQMLLTQGSDSVRVWNTDGTLRAALSVDGVSSAKFLAQDRIVTGTMGGAGELWNSTGASLAVLKTGGGGLDLFIKAVDPSAERFAATVNRSGLIEIWSATGELQSTLRAHQGHAWSAAFSPNSQHLASGGEDRVIRVWDWSKERCLFELYGHKSKVNAVEFHPTKPSLLVSSDLNGEVRLWGLDSPVRARHRGHNQAVRAMVLAPTGVLSSAADTMLWRFPEGNSYPLGGKLIGWNSSSRGGAAATADSSGVVRLWTWEPTTEPICHCEFRPHNDSPIRDATSSADWSKLVVVSENGVELWSDGGEHVCDLIGTNLPRTDQQRNAARWSGFRRDGAAIMTAAINGAVWLWGADGSPEGNFLADNASPDRIFDVDLDPQDEYILVGIRNEAGLWTWQGDLALELPSSGYKVLRVRFMPDGFRIVTIADNPSGGPSALVDLWNRDGEKLASPSAPNANEIIFDPESRYFCLQSSTDARIFDRDGALLGTLAAAAGTYIRSLAISATGTRVGGTVLGWQSSIMGLYQAATCRCSRSWRSELQKLHSGQPELTRGVARRADRTVHP